MRHLNWKNTRINWKNNRIYTVVAIEREREPNLYELSRGYEIDRCSCGGYTKLAIINCSFAVECVDCGQYYSGHETPAMAIREWNKFIERKLKEEEEYNTFSPSIIGSRQGD
jgi:hypothetical protein